jgi:hypothetical protein
MNYLPFAPGMGDRARRRGRAGHSAPIPGGHLAAGMGSHPFGAFFYFYFGAFFSIPAFSPMSAL